METTYLFNDCKNEIKDLFQGYFFIVKDILIDEYWVKSSEIVKIENIVISYHSNQYSRLNDYKISIGFYTFGGEKHTLNVIKHQVKDKKCIEDYLKTIFIKINK